MSINKMKRSVQKSQGTVEYNSRAADFISAFFFFTLNLIAILGEFTNLLSSVGRSKKGISFLYETVCAPVAGFFSRFFPLSGNQIYNWMVAESVFFATSLLVWLFVLIFCRIFSR